MAKVAREDIIKELEQIPDEMIPEVARVLGLLKEKYINLPPKKATLMKDLIKGHQKSRKLSASSTISWSENIKEYRDGRI